MSRVVGVLAAEQVAVGLVEQHEVVGGLYVHPQNGNGSLQELPVERIVELIRGLVQQAAQGTPIDKVGVGFPGIIRSGFVEESPNLPQAKGVDLGKAISSSLKNSGVAAPVMIFNDADVLAAGIAATQGHLDRVVRCWTLGDGVGYGRYPWAEGVWEGGHIVVTLDPKEHFCACGGQGHVEGIMGHRAMRLRFLDLEPEEVFENAEAGDSRCAAFVQLWHRALAAATASSIHMEGPGRFFLCGPKSKFVQVGLLNQYLHEMVKMSPLQGSSFEVIATSNRIGVIGAAVNAAQVKDRG